MPKSSTKMQSWQIWHFARKHLSRSVLYAQFGKKNARAVDFWCQDPKLTAKEDGAYDPISGLKSMLDALDDQGHVGVVRATMGFLFSGTSIEAGTEEELVAPLPSMTDEILADYRAVAEMQRAIEMGCDVGGVEHLLKDAIAELERTFALYCKEQS